MQVENKILYHVHVFGKKNDSLWHEGSEFYVGKEKNYFYEYYETASIGIKFTDGYKDQNLGISIAPNENIPIKQALNIINVLPPDLKKSALKVWFDQVLKALQEMCQFTREIIFEEVRAERFSHLPSRKTCIWLTEEEHLQTWLQKTHKGRREVFKLLISGNIHIANENFLISDTISHNEHRLNAEKYWSGQDIEKTSLKEILFEGSVRILEKISEQG